MRVSTINVSKVMLEAKLVENQKLIERMKSYKSKRTTSVTNAGQGIRALLGGEIFLNLDN